ncbi:hypothetical protein TraAM80_02857 [Trypanosoma rangeli]|uniref:Uncharacterized protein n=1 Tax=Trypanosoma rangeli TaxID=5698 RepID=A0A422NSG0_TRYRA|nr:uncharacterized protein TraAM80_02857 [Trypanosoma rangeli]RNF08396.1 hypothetical protein TraAM80_02857 [Trypanosoma rangeli]|eukprot:RNF08396.1 hypothetical protein TraAM80_02857 [Trypanosoma rangeli]
MLMETLEREVEALNAEVTRLRLMVYYMKDTMGASAPPSAVFANRENGYCSVCGRGASSRDPTPQVEAKSSSRGESVASDLVSQRVIEAVAHLLAASKDMRAVLPAPHEGCVDKHSDCLRQRKGSLKEKKRKT